MKSAIHEVAERSARRTSDRSRLLLGCIVELADGRPVVDFPGSGSGPIEARSAVPAPAEFDPANLGRIPVLLFFEDDETVSPIIIGFVTESLVSPPVQLASSRRTDVLLDGRRMVFNADKEIVLRCGKSSIYLGSDGKIVIKGTNLISRSNGTNKIKGAAVQIN